MQTTFTSTTDWHHDYIHLYVEVPGFPTEKTAKKFGCEYSCLYLKCIDNEFVLQLIFKDKTIAIPRSAVKIQEDQRPHPRPLNPSNPEDFQIIMNTIGNESSPYLITDDDLTDVSWTFEELAQRVPENCRFSGLSYGAKVDTSEENPYTPGSAEYKALERIRNPIADDEWITVVEQGEDVDIDAALNRLKENEKIFY